MDDNIQHFSFSSDNDYWNAFYEKKQEAISQESLFSHFVKKYIKKGNTLVDIGCGNGRDSIFFNSLGLNVIGIDGSTTAINLLQEKKSESLSFILGNFVNDSRIFNTSIDCYYSRFTLHAINEIDENTLLNNIAKNLKQNGYFFLEARSIHDEKFGKGIPTGKNTFILDGHHRRFLEINELKSKLEKLNFSIKYAEEKKDFAPFSSENSPIIRIVAKKKGFALFAEKIM